MEPDPARNTDPPDADEDGRAPGDVERPSVDVVPRGRHSAKSTDSSKSETFTTISMSPAAKSRTEEAKKTESKASEGSRRRCCCALRRKAPTFQQTLVVLRHSERQDYVDPEYRKSEEGLAWPHDAPLTEQGIKLAKEVAEEMAVLHEEASFVAIACSPYRRCLQTAAEVANRLQLPVVIDQELGEVRDRTMPQTMAHRSPTELVELVRPLGFDILNPLTEDRGIKVFGKEPVWPETLEAAKKRFIVRTETYIRQSAEKKHNMILVTHADAVAAVLVMFERGGADIQNMGFCARVVAKRTIHPKQKLDEEHGVYAERWNVDFKGLGAEILEDNGVGKYYERMYLETCAETQLMVVQRKDKRTKTDKLFDDCLKDLNGRV
uniref:Uncharacterized protein n=1 Tax=Alexandrium monilatum TaxID=311494 RepID=A0A7S4RM67_9DINO|mmetsp:Transcript_10474/g.33170  ORF Transcript_10474/g.33170 Transcript_10474/m.33170 type:complete len:379 (-) Transcript_10474:291-1427(-)